MAFGRNIQKTRIKLVCFSFHKGNGLCHYYIAILHVVLFLLASALLFVNLLSFKSDRANNTNFVAVNGKW